MFSCSRFETKQIQEGRATVITRRYDPTMGCPHEVGKQITLSSAYLDSHPGQEMPFAVATVVSIRPCNARELREDDLPGMKGAPRTDGFPNGEAWFAHLGIMYPGIGDDVPLHRIQFRIDDMEKDLAERLGRLGISG